MSTEFKVGLLFFLGLAGLFVFSLAVTDISLLKKGYEFEVLFPDAAGLQPGDKVLLSGVTIGSVSEVTFNEKGEVLLRCRITDEKARIPVDSVFAIKPATLLGGIAVYITPGESDVTVREAKEPCRGEPPQDVVSSLANAGDALTETFKSLEGKLDDVIAEVKKTLDMFTEGEGTIQKLLKDKKLYDDLTATVDNLKAISTDLREGKGTVGKILTDESLYDELKTTVSEIKTAIKDAQEIIGKAKESVDKGEGLLGELFSEGETLKSLKNAVKDIESFTSKLKGATESDSLLWQILKPGGGKMLDDISAAFADLKDMFSEMKEGKGLLQTLLYDEKLSSDVKEAATSVKNIVKRLEEAEEGSLWKLITEPELYEKAKKTLDDASEALSPIARLRVIVGVDTTRYDYQKETASSLYLRLEPRPTRYFLLGVTFFHFDRTSPVTFDYADQQAGDLVTEATFQMAQVLHINTDDKNPSNDIFLTLRGGLLEGKGGGGVDLEFLKRTLTFTLEGRDTHTDPERFYEHIDPFLLRFRAAYRIPLHKSLWLKFYAGVNNILDKAEFSAGICIEWDDRDIKSIVGVAGAAF